LGQFRISVAIPLVKGIAMVMQGPGGICEMLNEEKFRRGVGRRDIDDAMGSTIFEMKALVFRSRPLLPFLFAQIGGRSSMTGLLPFEGMREVNEANVVTCEPSVAFFERPRMKPFRVAAWFAVAGIFPKEGAPCAIIKGVLIFSAQLVPYGLDGLGRDYLGHGIPASSSGPQQASTTRPIRENTFANFSEFLPKYIKDWPIDGPPWAALSFFGGISQLPSGIENSLMSASSVVHIRRPIFLTGNWPVSIKW
jgi:hypothetical protein